MIEPLVVFTDREQVIFDSLLTAGYSSAVATEMIKTGRPEGLRTYTHGFEDGQKNILRYVAFLINGPNSRYIEPNPQYIFQRISQAFEDRQHQMRGDVPPLPWLWEP